MDQCHSKHPQESWQESASDARSSFVPSTAEFGQLYVQDISEPCRQSHFLSLRQIESHSQHQAELWQVCQHATCFHQSHTFYLILHLHFIVYWFRRTTLVESHQIATIWTRITCWEATPVLISRNLFLWAWTTSLWSGMCIEGMKSTPHITQFSTRLKVWNCLASMRYTFFFTNKGINVLLVMLPYCWFLSCVQVGLLLVRTSTCLRMGSVIK